MTTYRTKAAVLREVRRRWGKNADALHYPNRADPERRYVVGVVELGLFFTVKGMGASWNAAFAQADETASYVAKQDRKLRAAR